MTSPDEEPNLRIGELSRQVGVSGHVLRAWETRYGLLRPSRSSGGYRLFSQADVERVRRMQAHLSAGLSAAEAARAVPSDTKSIPAPAKASSADVAALSSSLREALDVLDEPAAQTVLDALLAELSLSAVLRDVVLPYLSELGTRWQHGTASIAQEHFASFVLRGRLAGLARGWGSGRGPRAVLACPPLELHDLALMTFGIVLNRHGWRIEYLGASTPIDELMRAAESTPPDVVVLAASRADVLESHADELARLAARTPLAIAGAGASPELAAALGAQHLAEDPVTEAERLGGR
jgi:DNA-binding transcriptional MerR regulator